MKKWSPFHPVSIMGILLSVWLWILFCLGTIHAQNNENGYTIIPELSGGEKAIEKIDEYIKQVWQTGGKVMEKYQELASWNKLDLSQKFASGIFSRTTILDYVVYLVRFLSQIGLVIGAVMIIYAGYLYASNIFTGKGTTEGQKAIKYAVIGVLVVVFAYAIMKLFTSLFLGT